MSSANQGARPEYLRTEQIRWPWDDSEFDDLLDDITERRVSSTTDGNSDIWRLRSAALNDDGEGADGYDAMVMTRGGPRRRRRSSLRRTARPGDLPELQIPACYRRDGRGTWRRLGGDVVPGSRDATLDSLWPMPDGDVVLSVGDVQLSNELAWVRNVGTLTEGPNGMVWVVDSEDWSDRAWWPLWCVAPELSADALLDLTTVSTGLGISPSTITSYRARRTFPPPQRTIGGRPAWSRPVISMWLRGRRRWP